MLTKLKRLYSMMGIFSVKISFLLTKCASKGAEIILWFRLPSVPRSLEKNFASLKYILTFLIYRTSQFNTFDSSSSATNVCCHPPLPPRGVSPSQRPLLQLPCNFDPRLISHLKWGPGVLFPRNLFPRNLLNIDNHFGACWCFFTQFNDLLHVRVLLQFFYNIL